MRLRLAHQFPKIAFAFACEHALAERCIAFFALAEILIFHAEEQL
jgi:hypothetical protein